MYASRAASVIAFFWLLTSSLSAPAAAPALHIPSGPGQFSFTDMQGDTMKRMTVYTYVPSAVPPQTAPIVFVLHGVGKNARGYRDTWIPHADQHGFMVIAPLFDREQWGRGTYSHASITRPDGTPQDPSLWSFYVIEHLFDAIKAATGNVSATYFLYGHSEGGQFVHRLVLLLPNARYARAIAANPGWYTRPTMDIAYPYGLGGAPASAATLKRSLEREFVLMLGELDADPNHSDLRKTPEAMAQGRHRFERGQNFMKEAGARAAELNTFLRWRVVRVPDAAHESSKMAGPAATVLMGRR